MGCGISRENDATRIVYDCNQTIPQEDSRKHDDQTTNVVALNGYLCCSNAGAQRLCSDVRPVAERTAGVFYTTNTGAGYEAMCTAAERREQVFCKLGNSMHWPGPRKQQPIDTRRAPHSWRRRRLSAPERLSGGDRCVEDCNQTNLLTTSGATPRAAQSQTQGHAAARGRILRVATLY